MISMKPVASSTPGMFPTIPCRSGSIPFSAPSSPPISASPAAAASTSSGSENAPSLCDASISITDRFAKPATGVGSAPNFCANASLVLCAGSVEMIRIFFSGHRRASCVPSEHVTVVLPTPPLPPTKIHRSLLPTIQSRFGSGISSSSSPSTSSIRSLRVSFSDAISVFLLLLSLFWCVSISQSKSEDKKKTTVKKKKRCGSKFSNQRKWVSVSVHRVIGCCCCCCSESLCWAYMRLSMRSWLFVSPSEWMTCSARPSRSSRRSSSLCDDESHCDDSSDDTRSG